MKRMYIALFVFFNLYAFTGFAQNTQIGGIINAYTPVLAFNPCDNKITVEDAASFRINDTVLIIQMKGAIIDSGNNSSFGTVMDYRSAGNYEINYIKSINGNIIELKNVITRSYNIPDGRVQLIRVPYFQNATVTSTLTCLPWDGSKGGVAVINVADTLSLNAEINVSGKGFRGGSGYNSQAAVLNCFKDEYFYPQSDNVIAGQKGESIAELSSLRNYGKGNNANGGGGGQGHNSGGGGGSNAGNGGFGGYQLDNCGNSPFNNRGFGGAALNNSSGINKIFLGGGGGAGQADNPGNPVPNGGNGGGIIIITGNILKTNTFKIISNGDNASSCSVPPGTDCHDAMGGGGGGGTIVLFMNQYLGNTNTENNGGKGADMVGSVVLGGRIGSGGGGGGGSLFAKGPAIPASIINNNAGGLNGVLTQDGNNAWGATPGQNGFNYPGFNLQTDNTPFRRNIDSVRIKVSLITCNEFDFKGFGFTNTHPVSDWQWSFGDGGTASVKDVIYSYSNPGPFTVKLIVTDINGCKDSISKDVNPSFLSVDAGPGDTICTTGSTLLQSSASGAQSYSWSPAAYLNNASILSPVATPPATTTFYLTATNTSGCSQTDSVRIDVRSDNGFTISPPEDICINNSARLIADGGDIYNWFPTSSLNNALIPNPVATPAATTLYTVNIIDTLCGFSATLSTIIVVRPLPSVRASKSNDIDCLTPQSRLNASGALLYTWSPASSLNNPDIQSPIAIPTVNTLYTVTGTDAFGCSNTDSITVKISTENKSQFLMPTAFTPNNDGLNDCYRVKYWGQIQELEFSVYNRWGERVFFTKNPEACWDGLLNGVPQNPGVFVYMIKDKTSCQSFVFRKGTFALIK